jgi:hypothetical protein
MNIQQIYDALHTSQKNLLETVNSYHSRNDPAFQIDALATQIANLNGAVALLLKALGAKTHE